MTFATNATIEFQVTDARLVGSPTTTMVGNYTSEATLDTHLNAASAGYFTAAVLASMTLNDKIYAVRMYQDPQSFGTPGTTVLPTGV